MYLLTACLIVVVLSAAISFRRCRLLSRNRQGRLALLDLSAPCQLLALAEPEHGRTIPLAVMANVMDTARF
ncbi:hypothetical protein SAMN05216338_1001889 [Bradyrhizobium sp. Rc2d]|nr:hypothetical protein SAMN05216338_1001889 [Bradyrhizobium sp. Rc2d]